ncbi:MAG TPA: hypothetical protein DD655_08520, partial [Halieaceae bacterium]|nr:hypothetical protein [Halieaceae bacterium]
FDDFFWVSAPVVLAAIVVLTGLSYRLPKRQVTEEARNEYALEAVVEP